MTHTYKTANYEYRATSTNKRIEILVGEQIDGKWQADHDAGLSLTTKEAEWLSSVLEQFVENSGE